MHLDTTPATFVHVDADCDGFPDLRDGRYAVGEVLACDTCGGEHAITAVVETAIAHNITIIG